MKKIIIAILTLALAVMPMAALAEGGQPLFGVYTDQADGVGRLRIAPDDGGSSYRVELTLFRTADLAFSAEMGSDGSLTGSVDDENGAATLVVTLRPVASGVVVTFSESGWEVIPRGSEYSFVPGAPETGADVFTALFDGELTGFQGTAGASLKCAVGAAALLETVVYADAGFWAEGRLNAVLGEAMSALDASKRAELIANMTGGVIPLIDRALESLDAVRGQLEDAGVYEAFAEMTDDPFARANWSAFKSAFLSLEGNG